MYICECGKEFDNPQSFNGHKSHCVTHHKVKGDFDSWQITRQLNIETNAKACKKYYADKRQEKQEKEIAEWVAAHHICEACGKVMTVKFGSGRFCNSTCANSRKHSEDTKQKIAASVQQYADAHHKPTNLTAFRQKYPVCIVCGKDMSNVQARVKTCSQECLSKAYSAAGRKAASIEVRRSKNEIYFCELCENYFNSVRHNEPIFNGWDADIIIDDYKIAVLWNGIWHYKQVRKNQSLDQVQSRDKIKLDQIKQCGYIPYIIKDLGYNRKFVEEQFDIFLQFIKSTF